MPNAENVACAKVLSLGSAIVRRPVDAVMVGLPFVYWCVGLAEQAGRDDDRVDHVDDAVRRQDVGGDDGCAAVERQLPDVGRVGGLTEARRVCDLAAERGRLVVPHGWKTGITIAATAHLAAVTPHMPFFEFVPQSVAESALRRELVVDELELVDGLLALPQKPGLGVELNREALERFEEAARKRQP